jgi:hypothetical protein
MAQRDSAEEAGSATDQVRGLTLTVTPTNGEVTTIRSAAGTLTLRDAKLALAAIDG